MLSLLILIVLLIIGVVAAGLTRNRELDLASRRFAFGATIASCILFLITLFFSTFTLVRAVEVGIPVTFGHVGQPLPSGVHFTAPWTDVETYPTRPLNVDVKAVVRTGDAGNVTITTTARWKVRTDKARELYFQSRTGDEEKIGREIVAKNLGQAIGDVYNVITNTDATKRDGRSEAIRGRLQALVDPYGITIDSILLRGIDPDPTTAQAIADLAAQQRKTKIAVEANNTALQEAKRRLTEAQGLRQAAAQIPDITPEQAFALCIQAWERGLNSGRTIYDAPCDANGGAIPTVGAR